MADGPSLTEIVVSRLGQPKEPFEELLALIVLAAALAAWLALEYGAWRLLAKLFAWLSPKPPPDSKPSPESRSG